jgi:hypothetical protein
MHSRACPERGSCSRSRPRSDPLAPRGNTGSADHVLPLLRDSERRAACEAATRVANALRTNAFYRRGDPYTCREPDLLRLASDLTRRWRRCSLKRALLPDRRLRAVTPSCASRKIRGRCPQALRPDDDPGPRGVSGGAGRAPRTAAGRGRRRRADRRVGGPSLP